MVCIAFPDHTRAETGIRLLTCTTSSAGSSTRCWMPDCRRRRALRTRRRELGTVLLLHAYVGVWSEGTLPTKFSDHSATWWDKRLIETLSQLGVVPRVCYDTPVSRTDRKSTRLNSSHVSISYAVFCLKKKTKITRN